MPHSVPGYQLEKALYKGPRFILRRATRESDGAPFAITLPKEQLPASLAADELALERELLASLDGDVGLPVVASLESARGLVLVRELPAGISLQQFFERRPGLTSLLRVLLGLARGLGQLHDQRVIHNDLRPESVWVEPASGQVCFLDLTSAIHPARETASDPLEPEQRDLQRIAPEQTGRLNGSLDHRVDLYALGLLLYEGVSGVPPFAAADPVELLHAHLTRSPQPLSERAADLPAALSDIAARLLEKSPGDRYQGSFGVAADLQECLDLLQILGEIPPFPLAKHDRSPRLRQPRALVGRDVEIERLRALVSGGGGPSLFVVSGFSGIGKTSLIQAALAPLSSALQLVRAKADAVQLAPPYSVILEACRQLVRQLMAQPEESLERWRRSLAARNPLAGETVAALLPELTRVLDVAPAEESASPGEAERRVLNAFQDFLQSFASAESPLVLFLDDLQWSDGGSIQVLEALLTDVQTHDIHAVVAWREEDVDGKHPLYAMTERARQAGVRVQRMPVGPLSEEGVSEMLVEMSGEAPEVLAPLVAEIARKSRGNPYYAMEFIEQLYQERALRFDSEVGRWRWSVEAIRQRPVMKNVSELMALRVGALPESERAALSAAACVGFRFEEALLRAAARVPDLELRRTLLQLTERGLLVALRAEEGGAEGFQFAHDKVQETAVGLLSADRAAEVHRDIAVYLLGEGEPREDRIYLITDHLNLGASSIREPGLRQRWLTLNLRAGQLALLSSAFERADVYFSRTLDGGQALEGRARFELTLARAESSFLCGRADEASGLFEQAFQGAPGVLEQATVRSRQAAALAHRDHNDEAVARGLEGLALLGVAVPRSPGGGAILAALARAFWAILRSTPASRQGMAEMTDARQREAMGLLLRLSAPTRRLEETKLSTLIGLTMTAIWLKHGKTRESPYAYMNYAALSALLFRAYDRGYAMGRQAMEMAREDGDAGTLCQVLLIYGGWICHLRENLGRSIALLDEAQRLGRSSGELMFAGFAATGALSMLPSTGHALPLVHDRVHVSLDLARRLQNTSGVLNTLSVGEWVRLLAGPELFKEPLPTVEALIESPAEVPWAASLDNLLLQQARYLLGDHEGALRSTGIVLEQPAVVRLSSVYSEYFTFYQALNTCALAGGGGLDRKAARLLKRAVRFFEKVTRRCPANGTHRLWLVRAERARVEGRSSDALEAYEQAIAAATENQFPHEQALAQELAGRFHAASGRVDIARLYLARARQGYARWGARALVARLDRAHTELNLGAGPLGAELTSGAGLDVSTLIKTSQAISGELVLADLLTRLVQTLVEYAGAERALLVLEEGEGAVIVASREPGADGPQLLQDRPVHGSQLLCEAAIRYVQRTDEPVVLEDAFQAGAYQEDDYIRAGRVRSMLCAGVYRQGQRVGLLYLENNLVAGAFSVDRVALLNVLSSQAAISIENARLYETLEDRVARRTSALRDALKQLTETRDRMVFQEKLAALGTMAAGIAHEIKNPLHFITNFSQLNIQIAEELKALLDADEAAESEEVRELIERIVDNASRVLSQGRRADQIVQQMSQHASQGASAQRPVDLNKLIREHLEMALGEAGDDAPRPQVELALAEEMLPITVSPQDIGRVILNLVKNASYEVISREAGSGYTPTIRVSTLDEGEQVHIRVWDNGGGISEEMQARILDPFFTTKDPGVGTGLGLSLCQEIVAHGHRGRLEVRSQPGSWSEFQVTLPRQLTRTTSSMG